MEDVGKIRVKLTKAGQAFADQLVLEESVKKALDKILKEEKEKEERVVVPIIDKSFECQLKSIERKRGRKSESHGRRAKKV